MLIAKCLLLDGVPLPAYDARAMPPMFLQQLGECIALGNFVHDSIAHGEAIDYGVAAAFDSLPAQVPAFRNGHLSEEHGASLLADADVLTRLSYHLQLMQSEEDAFAAVFISDAARSCLLLEPASSCVLYLIDSHQHTHNNVEYGSLVAAGSVADMLKTFHVMKLAEEYGSLTYVSSQDRR